MKHISNIKLTGFLFFIGILIVSCVHDDDYAIPEINVEEPNIDVNTNLVAVKDIYRGYEPKIIEAGDGSNRPLYLEAYVVSNDETGNFYKSLVIQDAPQNPTAGVALSTEATNLYTKYEPGRKIYFRVDGLYIGEYAGLPTIGIQDGDEVGRINIEDFESRIFRSTEKVEIVPSTVEISEVNDPDTNPELLNTLIKLENVQFPDGLAGVAHYGNPSNTYSVNRQLENCEAETIMLRTSGYSDYKGLLLPEGNGSLIAVLSRFNNDMQLFIRDIDDVEMNGERCNQGGTGSILELPFLQDFEGHNSGTDIPVDIEGWTNVNVNGGATVYEVLEFNLNNYAQVTARSSGENPCEVWMVTPGLILPANSAPILTFDTNDGYYNGDGLMLKLTTNFTGDVTTTDWTSLNAIISTGHTDGYGPEFTFSGPINLSAYVGETVHIAFQYLGSSSGGTNTTYQIDNISVVDNP
ncbi:DUF5689 domain-containing protein [Aequorivita marina]|uniref:DUF5689 domain-containing protein n=1 Tax=Aequorivita marina TaxID=3073654 RepID=UPI0028755785|nr:DUF5689 domain-containing protein [Aequorivita sp. S2608]MDS1298622.1 DUF5689 domain-containing protein [Aequorivita sp. S2608]